MIWKFREMLTESNWIHMRAFFKLVKYEELISSSPHNKVVNSTFLSQQKFEMGNHVLSELVAVFRDRLSDLNFEPGIHGPKRLSARIWTKGVIKVCFDNQESLLV